MQYRESLIGIIYLVFIVTARGEGECSKHRKGDSPKFHCFHFVHCSSVLFGKDTENGKKALGKAQKSDAEGKSLKLF
jgi:hypothetical protein